MPYKAPNMGAVGATNGKAVDATKPQPDNATDATAHAFTKQSSYNIVSNKRADVGANTCAQQRAHGDADEEPD